MVDNKSTIKQRKSFINWCGLLGIISFLSYLVAVIFSPLKYPGYDWMAQAVSDLSAANSPSLKLWNQLSCLYGVCGLVCCMMACGWIRNKGNRFVRLGIYLFTTMNWISCVGYTMFPLSDSGFAGTFQDIMHIILTVAVVVFSIASLVCIIIGSVKNKEFLFVGAAAGIALAMMITGPILMNILPKNLFGVAERFSVFAAAGYNAVIGIWLLSSKSEA